MSTMPQLPKVDSHPEIKRRIDTYNQLPALYQTIVHLFAIIYNPTSRTNILNSLKKLCHDDLEIKRFKVGDLDPVLDHLTEQGIVEQEEMRFQCVPF
ncbi:hypothetical protein [Desulfosarcina ovata]|nr:hypothetical protein [Desulfosarcina ovata]